MSLVSPSDLFDRFPEFTTTNPDRLTQIQTELDDAESDVPENWLSKQIRGIIYLAAHRLAMIDRAQGVSDGSGTNTQGNAIGNITSITASQESQSTSWSDPSASSGSSGGGEAYSSTIYGQRYLELRKTIAVSATIW